MKTELAQTIDHGTVTLQHPAATVVSTDAASLMAVISRAAADPSTDVDKLERLMSLYERITAKAAEQAYAQAFAAMQPELPEVTERGGIKDRSGKVQSTYALWEDINEAIKPVLSRHGFSISFKISTRDSKISVTAVLRHGGGHADDPTMELLAAGSGNKNAVQAVASSVSYGKRYTAAALLNLTSRGEDDDGHTAGTGAKDALTEDQIQQLRDALDATNSDVRKFCAYYKIDSLADLPPKQLAAALALVNRKSGGR